MNGVSPRTTVGLLALPVALLALLATSGVAHALPSIDIRKEAEGFDTRQVARGSTVTFEIVVTNTGTENIRPTKVTDSMAPDCARPQLGQLNVGQSITYTCTVTNVQHAFVNKACGKGAGKHTHIKVKDCDKSEVTLPAAAFLVIDEESIDNGNAPNFFSATDVNDDIAAVGQRTPLRWFQAHVGQQTTVPVFLWTGQVGDEGWFAPETIPASWNTAGPTSNGLRNYLLAGPGLGSPDVNNDPESLLDLVPNVNPLRATGLSMLIGRDICAVVYDSDISINYNPLTGSLKGATLGIVAFRVDAVNALTGQSSSTLPEVTLTVWNALKVCNGAVELFTDAPEPTSSSEPFDTTP